MLLPEQVKPFLLHEDTFVRKHAVKYFAKSHNRDPELMPLLLDSCARCGEEASTYLLCHAVEFAQTDSTLRTILGRLERASDYNVIYHYNNIIAHADLELIKPLISTIGKNKNIQPGAVSRLDKRMDLLSWDTNRLWNELFAFSEANAQKYSNEFDFDWGCCLVEALAARDDVPVKEIINCLNDEETYHRYDELYLTMLAGEIGLSEFIPLLINKLSIDADMLCERAGESLIKIGTEEVITRLKEQFPGESWHFRCFAAHIFGDIKLPAGEAALLELFPSEEELDIKTFLAMAWCNLISEKGVPPVRQFIDDGYDSGIVDLREPLYAACKMLGLEAEELQAWKKDFNARELKLKRVRDSFNSGRQASPSKKVGRNEPCPCGSGIKYKKCCGR